MNEIHYLVILFLKFPVLHYHEWPHQHFEIAYQHSSWCRKTADNAYKSTTWQIRFDLDNVVEGGIYKLRLALASAHNSDLQVHCFRLMNYDNLSFVSCFTLTCLQVRVNDVVTNPPLFSSGVIGADNAIARHGIHGIYWLFNVDIPAAKLVQGGLVNTIYLTQARSSSPFQGVMYDYIRLEAPSSVHS